MLKKIIVSFLILLTFSSVFLATSIKAQESGGTWYNQTFPEWYAKVYDSSNPSEIFGERYTAAQVQWIFYSVASLLVPLSNDVVACVFTGDLTSDNCKNTLGSVLKVKPSEDKTGQTGAKAFLADVFQERPLSLTHYVKDTARHLKIIPEVQAQSTQGFGFSNLTPILDLWRASRNIAYALMVLVIIALSFMIMFRVKISPQTVISVQSALPKIAIALVLVTFSYAIAGFLVDVMYVLIGLISLILASSGVAISSNPIAVFDFLTKGAILGVPLGIFGLFGLYVFLFSLVLFFTLFVGNGIISAAVSTVISFGAIPALYSIISLIVFVILLVLFLWYAIKTIWLLIKTFASILLLTILAPFQIVFGVISPSVGFGAWLKSFIGQLSVFPIVGLMLALSFVFLVQTVSVLNTNIFPSSWTDFAKTIPAIGPTLFSNGWPPLIGISDKMFAFLWLGVSLIIMTMIPKTADLVKSLVEGKPFAYGSGIGEAAGKGAGAVRKFGVGKAAEYLERTSGDEQATGTRALLARILKDVEGLR